MRIPLLRPPSAQASVLAVALITSFVIGLVLVSYMTLVSNHQRGIVRSELWNAALPVAEAGIEDALAHLNRNYPTNLVSQGWRISGNNLMHRRPWMDGYYSVRVSVATNPVIVSSGFVRVPWNDTFVSRTVRVTAV